MVRELQRRAFSEGSYVCDATTCASAADQAATHAKNPRRAMCMGACGGRGLTLLHSTHQLGIFSMVPRLSGGVYGPYACAMFLFGAPCQDDGSG